ncbi:hypothetical protein QQ73_08320, partial [Candidatus Endoriftia persephone str. Guaymas]|nr:hypothetical protein [Candidatus Endoriftia persephone str. Guaymas]
QGRIHKGRISAANELDLDLRVRKMHLELLSHRRSRNHGRKRFGLGGNRRPDSSPTRIRLINTRSNSSGCSSSAWERVLPP